VSDQAHTRSRRTATGGKPSIYDVAALAGVSHQTVSRVVNGHPTSVPRREKVLAAMAEIDYTPSSIARALATNRSRRIGVIVDSPRVRARQHDARQAARDAGYAVAAVTVDGDLDGAYEAPGRRSALRHRTALFDPPALRQFGRDLPTMLLTTEPENDLLTVAVDQYAGAVHAVDHLIALGHRRILHLAGPADWGDARVRSRGFSDRLTAEGLPLLPELSGDWSSDSGYRIGRSAPEIADATAIFVGNDQMALGLIHALHERGIRVPEDISIVGFDDLPDARHFLPPLTTVRQDFAALGRLSIQSLLAALDHDPTASSAMIEPELVVRASTARPR
jgi:DNA-binding LacI/PurR family transcriptional regulator